MTQHQKILNLMRQRGEHGINSFDARLELRIIQLPARIKELKQMGYTIITKENKNRSVNYILLEIAKESDQRTEKIDVKPIQESLL